MSCCFQQLLESSFPVVEVPAVEDEEELLNLSALLQLQPCESEEDVPDVSRAQRLEKPSLGFSRTFSNIC